ncbi:FIG00640418: hypothetical protein [hydrothermal vent metagenome]|uniref:Uncharacterized protein n=1 Tax=hydrothermal vent metagenome TaxID=652676 RepID=A0A3B1A257_9ZZZZ
MITPPKMANEVKWATRQRYQYIEVMAFYTGVITRKDVARTFAISDAAATKDLKAYGLVAPNNLTYKQNVFGFVPSDSFVAMFADLSPQVVLSMFSANLAVRGNPTATEPNTHQNWIYGLTVDQLPLPTRLPDKNICAQLVRAISNKQKLQVQYLSLSDITENTKTRIIEPHSLVDNGLRWHVRAYNEDSYDFRDFVLSRIIAATLINVDAESSAKYDDDWSEYVTLKLKPHPKLSLQKQQSLLYDFNVLENDDNKGLIELAVRRALVAYVLQRLSVDTTEDHSLNPNSFQLVLINRDDIEWFAGWSFI